MELCLPAQGLVQIKQFQLVCTSASVLCCQLQLRGRWELPSHKGTCQGKGDAPIPGDSEGLRGAGEVRSVGRAGAGDGQGWRGSVPSSGEAVTTHARLLAGSWRMSHSADQPTTISRSCSSDRSMVRAASLRSWRLLLVRAGRAEPSRLAWPPPWPEV